MNRQEQADEESRKLIEKWRGGHARLWEYDISLSRLVIRIEAEGRPGNLHITCLSTEFIRGPVRWNDCSLEMREISYKGFCGNEVRYALRDESIGFEVHSSLLGAMENVEPIF